FCGVVSEGLGDDNTCVVDQGIDTPEALDCGFHDLCGDVVVADVTTNRDDALVGGRLNAAGISYYNKAVVTIGFDDGSTDALRGAGDDVDFLFIAHNQSFLDR